MYFGGETWRLSDRDDVAEWLFAVGSTSNHGAYMPPTGPWTSPESHEAPGAGGALQQVNVIRVTNS
eukprot:7216520-Heterocapsa_arctica.AAC.1